MSWQHWVIFALQFLSMLVNTAKKIDEHDGSAAMGSFAAGLIMMALLVWGQP